MYDFSRQLQAFHDEHVRLTEAQRKDIRRRRDANRDRIIGGLEGLEKPAPVEWINQGGYAMKTMTQSPENDVESLYDIDMGVVFDTEDAKGPRTTKGWVRDAIAKRATNLKNVPEAKPKCVRVVYADGYQCDFPVFRRLGDGSYEIAVSDDWITSDPQAVNRWFEEQVERLSPDEDGAYQLRRIVRFVKYIAKTHARRRRTKFPAGLIATALAVECYSPAAGRDDIALYETLSRLSIRSASASVMANGIVISDDKDVDRIKRLVEQANDAVEELGALFGGDATEDDARRAWGTVFRHSFFDVDTSKASLSAPSILGRVPASTLAAALTGEEAERRAAAAVRAIERRDGGNKPWTQC